MNSFIAMAILTASSSANRLLELQEATSAQLTCGGFEHCLHYTPDGCNSCNCDGHCTKRACLPPQLARCTVCDTGYTLNGDTGECEADRATPLIPSCGGIPYCASYKPDNCNQCRCGEGMTTAFCTRAFCGAPNPTNECTQCVDGYSLGSTGECQEDAPLSAPCVCPMVYSPICCEGTTFDNSCTAKCEMGDATDRCFVGRCEDAVRPVTLPQTLGDANAVTLPQPLGDVVDAVTLPQALGDVVDAVTLPQPIGDAVTLPQPLGDAVDAVTLPQLLGDVVDAVTLPQALGDVVDAVTLPQPIGDAVTLPQPIGDAVTLPQPLGDSVPLDQ